MEIVVLVLLIVFMGAWWASLVWLNLPSRLDKILKACEENSKNLDLAKQNTILIDQNAFLKTKQAQYNDLFEVVIQTLREDTSFFRSRLAQDFLSHPQYAEMANLVLQFENRIIHIQTVLREQKIITDTENLADE